MRISEIIISEAISITPHAKSFENAIKQGLARAFNRLTLIKGTFPDEEKEFEEGYSQKFRDEARNIVSVAALGSIPDSLLSACDKTVGYEIITDVEFKTMKYEWGGYASGTRIVINSNYLTELIKVTLDNFFDIIYNRGQEYGKYINTLVGVAKEFASGDSRTTGYIFDRAEKTIQKIAKTMVHEVVHVMQHSAQYKMGKSATEYRSYLDKKKGEFVGLHTKKYQDYNDPSMPKDPTVDDSRYDDLYYSSPQEMGAFANDIALEIIGQYGFDEPDLENLKELAAGLDQRDIVAAIQDRIGDRFKKPRDKKELAVYKRYIKLVYLEIQRYIESRLKDSK